MNNNNKINFMKRLLITLFLLFFANFTANAEEFPPTGKGIAVTKETNPIYWGYLEDYGALLKTELEKSKMFRLRGMGAAYDFILTRDGEIKDMYLSVRSPYKYFNKNIEKIILSVPPIPFRDGMNMDEMQMSVYLGYQRYDEIYISVGSSFINKKKVFIIDIDTSK